MNKTHDEETTHTCPNCSSTRLRKRGKRNYRGVLSQRYSCKECHTRFYQTITDDIQIIAPDKPSVVHYVSQKSHSNRTWVITSAVSDTACNKRFLETLLNYCRLRDAELIVIPIRYKLNGLADSNHDYSWSQDVQPYLLNKNTRILDNLVIMAGININPAIASPLAGLEAFSKGDSLIFGGTQLAMRTAAMSHVDDAAIIHTTGAVTESLYSESKAGGRASFNHSFSALVVEQDNEIDSFHIRVLNSDSTGSFYDIGTYYYGDMIQHGAGCDTVVMGDEHIVHVDPTVTAATFNDADSIVNTLRPKYIIRHDSYDHYSSSHHHWDSVFTNYAKLISGKNSVENELSLTIQYILDTTPSFSESVIVDSNHNTHLCKWLQTCNIKMEIWNSLLYHELSFLMLKNTKMGLSKAEYPNPLELWANNNFDMKGVKFIGGHESFKRHGIELAMHGDRGQNGSRGSAKGFSNLGIKSITGHGHSPMIVCGAWVVGHSAYSRMDYNSGPSGWRHAHVIINHDGKRQMLFITKGKWKR